MRHPDDIVALRLDLSVLLSLDWERIETDPGWELAAHHFDLADPEQKKRALARYIGYYVSRELMFQEMPSTNGPGEALLRGLEFVTPPAPPEEAKEHRPETPQDL